MFTRESAGEQENDSLSPIHGKTRITMFGSGDSRIARERRVKRHAGPILANLSKAIYGCGAEVITDELQVSVFRMES
jgi:hypothetical protein